VGVLPQGLGSSGLSGERPVLSEAVVQLGVRNDFDGVLPTWLRPEETERTVVGTEKEKDGAKVGENFR
jgi:hypothetical protein